MKNDKIESLLRRALPAELPVGLKHRVLHAARENAEPITLAPRMAWTALAACWTAIVLLRTTTPEVSNGNQPFDREAFLARPAILEWIVATGQLPEETETAPVEQSIPIESILPIPKASSEAWLPKGSPGTFI
jgi:hypothetical protein